MGGGSLHSPSPLTQDTYHKTDPSDCQQRPNGHSVRFSSRSVNSGYHFSSINSELVLPPYKATSTKCEVDNNFSHGNKILPNGILQHNFSQAERKSWEGQRSAHPHRSKRTPITKPIRAVVGNILTDVQSDFQADLSTLAITFPL